VIAYFDSSALVKLFLVEEGSGAARDVWDSGIHVATSRISQAELSCALAAAVRDRRYARERVDDHVVDGTFLHDRAVIVEASPDVVGVASTIGVRHRLRGVDAVHVASALELTDLGPTLVSWDERQRQAARAEGLRVYPETTTAALR